MHQTGEKLEENDSRAIPESQPQSQPEFLELPPFVLLDLCATGPLSDAQTGAV